MRLLGALLAAALLFRAPVPTVDTLPVQLRDDVYWALVSEFSEPGGTALADFYTSNESGYQAVLPELNRSISPGGVYLGVGPEQNFTYIAALRPKIAFIVDIRRDIMLEHLMYKAIFEEAADRPDFVGRLFSRRRPAALMANSSAGEIFESYAAVRGEPQLAEMYLEQMLARLQKTHGFHLSNGDVERIRWIHMMFFRSGPTIGSEGPDYARLMTLTDGQGRNWSFLASKENYDRVRMMHDKNLIVPLVGDFAGPKTLRMIGQYLRDHGALVNVFYISNVENFLRNVWPAWERNVASLPVNESSVFIRWSLGQGASPNWLASMAEFVRTGEVR